MILAKDLTKKDFNQHPIFNANLGRGVIVPSPCWFSLNKPKAVKAVTLTF